MCGVNVFIKFSPFLKYVAMWTFPRSITLTTTSEKKLKSLHKQLKAQQCEKKLKPLQNHHDAMNSPKHSKTTMMQEVGESQWHHKNQPTNTICNRKNNLWNKNNL